MTIFGWDMSHYDWDRGLTASEVSNVKNVGISFVTHKIGEGSSYTDPRFDDFWRAIQPARRAGVLVGAYYVNWPGDNVPQAKRFISLLNRLAPGWDDGPFILQVDSEKFEAMPRPPSAGEIRTFISTLRSSAPDHRPVLYAPKWEYGDELSGVQAPLWASHYGANPATDYRSAYPGDGSARWGRYSGKTPIILQYGSNTRIGSQRQCDANAFRGTLAELRGIVYPKSIAQSPDNDKDDDMTAQEFVDALMASPMGHPGQGDLTYKNLLRNLHQQAKGPSFEDWADSHRLDELTSRLATLGGIVGEIAEAVRDIQSRLPQAGTEAGASQA